MYCRAGAGCECCVTCYHPALPSANLLRYQHLGAISPREDPHHLCGELGKAQNSIFVYLHVMFICTFIKFLYSFFATTTILPFVAVVSIVLAVIPLVVVIITLLAIVTTLVAAATLIIVTTFLVITTRPLSPVASLLDLPVLIRAHLAGC